MGGFIKICEFKALGQQLIRDRRTVPAVFGGREHSLMMEAMDRIQNRYFDDLNDYDNPNTSELADLLVLKKAEKKLRQRAANKDNISEPKDGRREQTMG